MNQEQKARYQRLQGFVYALQQETWTIKEIDKKTASAEVTNPRPCAFSLPGPCRSA